MRKGQATSEETKRKIGLANSKKRRTEEEKRHLSQILSGRKLSPETKEKIRQARIGIRLSSETKRKISSSLVGKKQPNRSLALKGRTLSFQHINAIRKAQYERIRQIKLWEREKTLHTEGPDVFFTNTIDGDAEDFFF